MRKPTKNIVGQGAIIRSLRKPRPKKNSTVPAALKMDVQEEKKS